MAKNKCPKKEFRVATTIVRCENYKPKGKFRFIKKKEKSKTVKSKTDSSTTKTNANPKRSSPFSDDDDKYDGPYFAGAGPNVQKRMTAVIKKAEIKNKHSALINRMRVLAR